MKVLLCLLVTLAGSSSFAMTGMAKYDENVAKLKQQFATAKAPTWDDLHVGEQWTCTYFSAFYKSNETASESFVFQHSYRDNLVELQNPNGNSSRMELTKDGIQGFHYFDQNLITYVLWTVKTLPNGELIQETAQRFWKILIFQGLVSDISKTVSPLRPDDTLYTTAMATCKLQR